MRKKLNWVNPPRPDPGRRKRITSKFFFTLLCGAAKGFMTTFKIFMKPFVAPQRSVKIKIQVNLYFNTTFWNARGGRVEKWCLLIFAMKYVKYDQAKKTIKRYGFFCNKNYMYFARTSCNEENKWYRQIQGYWIANARLLLPSMRYITE